MATTPNFVITLLEQAQAAKEAAINAALQLIDTYVLRTSVAYTEVPQGVVPFVDGSHRIAYDAANLSFNDTTNTLSVANLAITGNVGFFGTSPTTKTTLTDPAALTSAATVPAAYDQAEMQKIRDDLDALRGKVVSLTDALQSYGLG